MMKRRDGFTLIEIMVVVAIMALLAGMLLGGLGAAKSKAKKTEARRAVSQIATAWNTFYADYKRFPNEMPGNAFDLTEMNEDAVHIMHGQYDLREYPSHSKYKDKNPRLTAYLDFHEGHTGGYLDPWGNVYQLRLDQLPYDSKVDVPGQSGLQFSVAVWSNGPDGISGTADDVRSWDKR
jgi:prepilin-type N-terminal cleavage/methylation domain-containing protein